MSLFPDPNRGAVLSNDRLYRYRLWRRWGPGQAVAFLGLNPSTADETEDDPTIRRCIGFARDWGIDAYIMLNLYGWRSTHPGALWDRSVTEPVGADNDRHILEVGESVAFVVCAWGAFPKAQARGAEVLRALNVAGVETRALKLTLDGHPSHPLYLRRGLDAFLWIGTP